MCPSYILTDLSSCVKRVPQARGKEDRCHWEDLLRFRHCSKILAYQITEHLQMEVILSCFLGQPCVIIKEVSFENALPCIITIVVNPGSYTFFFFLPPLYSYLESLSFFWWCQNVRSRLSNIQVIWVCKYWFSHKQCKDNAVPLYAC